MTLQISSIFHQAPNEFDDRSFVPPRLYTPLDSRSYRDGVDPALVAILTPDTTAAVIDLMARALASGDTAAAERALATARSRTVNRFRSFERDVNALGYRLSGSGQSEPAIEAFRINTRAFPHSANTFDSLGEALLNAGYRDAAIAAYRQALVVEPGFRPSAEALQRIGAHPQRTGGAGDAR
jgi:tetratricopeptide (TPR) repeat protein